MEDIIPNFTFDLLVGWLEISKAFPKWLVKNGDESHGIESVKNHLENKHKYVIMQL